MTEKFIDDIRGIANMNTAILTSVTLVRAENAVEVSLVTDKAFTSADETEVKEIVSQYVPDLFSVRVKISKLTPDEGMVARKILEIIPKVNRPLSAFIGESDVAVEKVQNGFYFTVKVISVNAYSNDFIAAVSAELKKCFCGEFSGKCIADSSKAENIEIEEEHENIEYVIPVRTFEISDFSFIESTESKKTAVYLSDLNFISENVVVCGKIEDIRERTFENSSGKERTMFSFTLNDTTASMRISYFARKKSIEMIKKLQVGDSIVMTCKTDTYNGMVRATANFIDYGSVPEGFVPEKRMSKPVPKYYETIRPQPFEEFTQDDMFSDRSVPDCLKDNVFVIFDLETTGLNSSPSAGNMDRIIEIGAFRMVGGEITEKFSTFVNPRRKLSEEIVKLTGIVQSDVDNAPDFEEVMPDFFKFCDGAYLVGHNAANFDFKFVDYYCSQCGYMLERKLFDTFPLAQQLLRLSNYKLDTIANHFGITFNHHRAADDALVTAKIFKELIKIKKSLPNLC